MQVYTTGSDKAVELYKQAFDAAVGVAYPNDDGTFMHVELDIYGQCLAISEYPNAKHGDAMQFCLHLGEGHTDYIRKAYETLKDGAEILSPIGECPYSPLMFALIDKFGVNWCVFQ